MEIKELVEKAHKNAIEKGFHGNRQCCAIGYRVRTECREGWDYFKCFPAEPCTRPLTFRALVDSPGWEIRA